MIATDILNFCSRTVRNMRFYTSLSASSDGVKPPKMASHAKWPDFLSSQYDKAGMDILEIGSRVVTGACFRERFSRANYTGFDIYPGPNVDIVGDAHRLSSYFEKDRRFDLIFTSAVFEHLCMPWVVAQEIRKLLKVGGCVFVETHFSFRAHERPWNFFQFSDAGLRALFNKSMGFEVLDIGMSNPMRGYFSARADRYLRFKPVTELYCHSEILCVKTREIADFDWSTCGAADIVDGTRYPPPASSPRADSPVETN
jgi:SAM-dependent methyltransferase